MSSAWLSLDIAQRFWDVRLLCVRLDDDGIFLVQFEPSGKCLISKARNSSWVSNSYYIIFFHEIILSIRKYLFRPPLMHFFETFQQTIWNTRLDRISRRPFDGELMQVQPLPWIISLSRLKFGLFSHKDRSSLFSIAPALGVSVSVVIQSLCYK